MTKKGKANGSFFGDFLYEQILSQRPHFLKDLVQVVDFRFVAEHCKDFYADWGRDPWDPVLMFKMVFLQFLYDLSDRQMEEQAAFNLVYKWFLGLSVEELPPDFSTLCRFRTAWGRKALRNCSMRWWGKPVGAALLPTASTSSTPPISSPGWTCFA